MRTVVVVVAVALLGWLFLFQKNHENQKVTTAPAAATSKQTAAGERAQLDETLTGSHQ